MRKIKVPATTSTRTINALRAKFPLDLIHRIFDHVNVKDLQQSIKNKKFGHITFEDVD